MTDAGSIVIVGFDLDMTLVNSAAGIAATMQVALAEVGRRITADQVWPLVGVPMEATLEQVAPGVDVDAVTLRYRELYPAHGIAPITLLPGAAEAIEAVHAVEGRVVVVSAKVASTVRAVLDHVGLDRVPRQIDEIVGGLFAADKGGALRALGAQIYVGDHLGDIAAARAAGAVSVAVATGPYTVAQLVAAGADVVLEDLRAFPGWLAGWLAGFTAGDGRGTAPPAR
ncbi:MAG TPA: HAD hydrolase-like protein [Kineosporiaceae bacterium]|nr:HAD hydrolase-like protein [Kineosporiaceae bacterium]